MNWDELNEDGECAYSEGRMADAEEFHRLALAEATSFEENDGRLTASLSNLGMALKAQGMFDEAEQLFLRAIALDEKYLGDEHPDLLTTLDNLASLYKRVGRYENSETLLIRSVTASQRVLGDHPATATRFNNLGALYYEWARAPVDQITSDERMLLWSKAEQFFEQAIAVCKQALPPDHPDLATSMDNLGSIYREQKKFDKAIELQEQALQLHENALGPQHPAVARNLMNLASTYEEIAKFESAELLYARATDILLDAFGQDHPEYGQLLSCQATLYFQKGDFNLAADLQKQAMTILEDSFGMDHPLVAFNKTNYSVILRSLQDEYRRRLLDNLSSSERDPWSAFPPSGLEEWIGTFQSMALAQVTLHVDDTAEATCDPASPISRFGGVPSFLDEQSLPRSEDGSVLPLLLQLRSEDLLPLLLPLDKEKLEHRSPGMLYFFLDPKSTSSWRVIYSESKEALVISPSVPLEWQPRQVSLTNDYSLPGPLHPNIWDLRQELTGDELTAYDNLVDEYYGHVKHHLFGMPQHVTPQELTLASELMLRNLTEDEFYALPEDEAGEIYEASADWILLAQIDSEYSGFWWANFGRLYFMIKTADLHEFCFDRVMLLTQQHPLVLTLFPGVNDRNAEEYFRTRKELWSNEIFGQFLSNFAN